MVTCFHSLSWDYCKTTSFIKILLLFLVFDVCRCYVHSWTNRNEKSQEEAIWGSYMHLDLAIWRVENWYFSIIIKWRSKTIVFYPSSIEFQWAKEHPNRSLYEELTTKIWKASEHLTGNNKSNRATIPNSVGSRTSNWTSFVNGVHVDSIWNSPWMPTYLETSISEGEP
jgi:hypothetical protein